MLVNDGSTDNGEDIVKHFAEMDSRFRLLNNERGPGVSGARNTGMDHAKGEWITFLDADDEMHEYAMLAFKSVLDTEANMHQFNHLRYYRPSNSLILKYANYGGMYGTSKPPRTWWGVWNKLFRSSFVKDIRFDETLQYGEDGMFILECLAKDNRIHHGEINAITTIHRFDNKGSLSHVKTAEDIIKYIRAYEKFMFKQDDVALKRLIFNELSLLWERVTPLMK